jgi:hypothetical protein
MVNPEPTRLDQAVAGRYGMELAAGEVSDDGNVTGVIATILRIIQW